MKSIRTAVVVACAAGMIFTTGCFRVSSETRALRDSVLDNTPGVEWDEQIEIGLGMVTLGVAKLGVGAASYWTELPPEARMVLSAAKAAEVSVYHLEKGNPGSSQEKIITSADRAMEKRGWYRLVGVKEGDDLVAVYVPEETSSIKNATVCVLVINSKDLVCARAKADLRPLYELAMEKAGESLPKRPLAIASENGY